MSKVKLPLGVAEFHKRWAIRLHSSLYNKDKSGGINPVTASLNNWRERSQEMHVNDLRRSLMYSSDQDERRYDFERLNTNSLRLAQEALNLASYFYFHEVAGEGLVFILSEMIGAQRRAYERRRFTSLTSLAYGSFLRELYALGFSMDWEDIIRSQLGEELDPNYFYAELEETTNTLQDTNL